MKLELVRVKETDKAILKNLLELYEKEPNDYEEKDADENEPYEYKHLDRYFTRENWLAYFIMADGDHAGFILISPDWVALDIPTDYSLYEFFVLPKYRRGGVGKFAVYKILDMHKGKWQLKRDPRNKSSVPFWNNVIAEYTNGNFEIKESYPNSGGGQYSGGVWGDVFFFES
jgi:predicted acetyltransferase